MTLKAVGADAQAMTFPPQHDAWLVHHGARLHHRYRKFTFFPSDTRSLSNAPHPQSVGSLASPFSCKRGKHKLRNRSAVHTVLRGDHPNRHPRFVICDELRPPLRGQTCLRLRRIFATTPRVSRLSGVRLRGPCPSEPLRMRRIKDLSAGRLFENRLGGPTQGTSCGNTRHRCTHHVRVLSRHLARWLVWLRESVPADSARLMHGALSEMYKPGAHLKPTPGTICQT